MKHAKRLLGEKTIKRTFTDVGWKLMGKDKGGWVIDPKETKKSSGEVDKPKELTNSDNNETDGSTETDGANKDSKETKTDISNITVADVIVVLKGLKTTNEVTEYIGEDDRSGVKKAAAKRMSEIEEAAK